MSEAIILPKEMQEDLVKIRRFYGVPLKAAVIMSMAEGIDVHMSRIREAEEREAPEDDCGRACMDCAYCVKRSASLFCCIHPEKAAGRQCLTTENIQSNSCEYWEEQ